MHLEIFTSIKASLLSSTGVCQ